MQRSIINSYIFQNMSNMFRLNLFLIWLHCKYQHHPVPPRAPTRHWIIPRSSFCQSLTCSFEQKLYFCLLSFGQNYDNKIRNFNEPPNGQLNPFEIRRQRAQFLLFPSPLKLILYILIIGVSIIWRVSTASVFHWKILINIRLLM